MVSLIKLCWDSATMISNSWFIPKAIDSKTALNITCFVQLGVRPIKPAVAVGSLIGACNPPKPGMKKRSRSSAFSAERK